MRLKAQCKHGIVGALNNIHICSLCSQERSAQEETARKKAVEEEARRAEEMARRKEEKEKAYREYVRRIRLPEYLQQMDPEEFEILVCKLYEKMGFSVTHTRYSSDGGIDGFLRKDGMLSILQCKRVKGKVGEPVLRELFGIMHSEGASEGIIVTTGTVSNQARLWAQNKPINIIELDELVNLIRDNFKEDDVVPAQYEVTNGKS